MKALNTKLILLILSLIISFGAYFLVKKNQESLEAEKETFTVKSDEFGPEHSNLMKVDTFIKLVSKAYHPNVTTGFGNNLFTIEIKNANQTAKDFINGNEALLKSKIQNEHFEIAYDKFNNNITGLFKMKDSVITVPNDVLIQLVYKNFN
ncbi:MAG TPA: hypothetical protein VLZ83_02020 [Edaphocola sp.]|nr:hypothetical protein [Edaphocola sp.]